MQTYIYIIFIFLCENLASLYENFIYQMLQEITRD